MIRVIEELTASEEFWKRQAADPNSKSLEDLETPEVLEKLFGDRSLPRIELAEAGKPLFDYAGEVAAAKASDADMRAKLGAEAEAGAEAAAAGPEGGAVVTKMWVTDVECVLAPDIPEESGVYIGDPIWKMKLVGKLSGPVLTVDDGKLTEAVADNGADLLPEDDRARETIFADTTGRKKDYVDFRVKMKPLPEDVDGIKKLSGHLFYKVASGSKTVDIGELSIENGAKGKALEAEVDKVDEDSKRFGVKLKVETPSMIKEFRFTDGDGKKIEVNRFGYGGGMGRYSFSFRFEGDFRKKVKMEVDTYDKVEKHKLPFSAENLKLR